jgi:conjugal transfer pilus assembly protein TraW
MAYRVSRLRFAVLYGLLAAGVARGEALGPTYPIQEPDLLKEIEQNLKEKERTGELARLQREAIERSRRSIESPKPVDGLVRTKSPRTFYFDPTVIANRRITTPDGKVLVEAGQAFNPLDQVSLSQWLIFFDARDPAQVKKAEALIAQAEGRAKPILTGGSYIEIQKKWQRPVFFDQQGTLIRKFGIRQVPALVSQEGKRLRIDEVAL